MMPTVAFGETAVMQLTGSLADRPITVAWEVTRGAMSGRRAPRMCVDLTPGECLDVVDQIAEAAPRLLLISGDMVTRPDLVDIIARANARGIWVALRPAIRSRLLDSDFDALRDAGLRSLSVNFGHAHAQGVAHRIAKGLDTLAAARRARLAVQVKTAIPELADLPRLSRVMQALQPSEWRMSLPVPKRGEDAPNAGSTEKLLAALSHLPASTGVPLGLSDAPHFRRVTVQSHARAHSGRWRILPLNDGRGRVFISHRGEIQPGATLPIACGNVRLHHLLDVYRQARIFRQLRNPDLLKGKCGSCGFRLVCGGSRARAYASRGDYLAEDPACSFHPAQPGAVVPGSKSPAR
jgi:radical SAM protein with 4Fe4S-binding SPASM domain